MPALCLAIDYNILIQSATHQGGIGLGCVPFIGEEVIDIVIAFYLKAGFNSFASQFKMLDQDRSPGKIPGHIIGENDLFFRGIMGAIIGNGHPAEFGCAIRPEGFDHLIGDHTRTGGEGDQIRKSACL